MAPPSKRRAGIILGSAAAVGLTADMVLRAGALGANVALVTAPLTAAAVVLVRETTGNRLYGLVALPIAFAGFVAWRDDPALQLANVLATLTGLALVAMRARGVQLALSGVAAYLRSAAVEAVQAMTGGPRAVQELPWAPLLQRGSTRRASATVVGTLLAVPLLLVFAPLLMAADPMFDMLVRRLFDWDFPSIASHVVLTGLGTWVAAGYLHGLAQPADGGFFGGAAHRRPRLGMLEIGVPLGALASVFAVFVAVQVRYLFGGTDLVLTTAGLSFAEYARRGFFELVAVSALVVPVLLGSAWLLDRDTPRNARRYRILAILILGLVAAIMESAMARMHLYVDAYGLTDDRFYATAFMVWIGVVLAWFTWTVLFGDERRFAFGAILSGLAVLAVLNILNPHERIAAANLARADQGRSLDVSYLGRLSADAVPRVLGRLDVVPAAERCALVARYERRRASGDWRSWNVGRWRAGKAVERVRSEMDCPAG